MLTIHFATNIAKAIHFATNIAKAIHFLYSKTNCQHALLNDKLCVFMTEKAMPSFDVVSEVDSHELDNAIDQANREVSTRFDFKGTGAKYALVEEQVILTAPGEFQVQQMKDILISKLIKRSIDARTLEWGEISSNLSEAKQEVQVRQGIEKDSAKKIIKSIKGSKIKVQAAIQGEQIRITGKKRDDLQETIALLKKEEFEFPLQFNNFRD